MIIILTVKGATGKIWYSGFDLESIVGMIHRKVKVDPCVCLLIHGVTGLNEICEFNLSKDIIDR